MQKKTMLHRSSGRTGNGAVLKPDTCDKDLPAGKDGKREEPMMLRMPTLPAGSGVEAPAAPAKEGE